MDRQIQVPTVGIVSFPYHFSDDQIASEIEGYRERKRKEAEDRGEISDWDALERVNRQYGKDFYELEEAHQFLKGSKEDSEDEAKWEKRKETASLVGERMGNFIDIARHTEVGFNFASAVTRDILEAATSKDYPIGSLVLENRGWDNVEEFFKKPQEFGSFEMGPYARGYSKAVLGDEEPIEKHKEGQAQWPSDEVLHPFYTGVSEGVEHMGPIAMGALAQRAGIPAWMAFGGAMGTDTYGKTGDPMEAAKSAGMGAVVPSIGQAGRSMAGAALAKISQKAPLLANATTAQKAVESTFSLGTIGAVMEGINYKEYLQASPEQREEMLWHAAGSLAVFMPMEAAAVMGRPSQTQSRLPSAPVMAMSEAMRGYEAIYKSKPAREALRKMADDYARDALDPNNVALKIREASTRLPEADIIEAKTRKTMVPMTEAEAVEAKTKGIDPYEPKAKVEAPAEAKVEPEVTLKPEVKSSNDISKEEFAKRMKGKITPEELELLYEPDIWTGLEQGKPTELKTFRGEGKGPLYAEGVKGPSLGKGRYSALNEKDAAEFGATKPLTVKLKNPAVIEADADLAKWMGVEFVPKDIPKSQKLLRKAEKAIKDAGHDGVIVNIRQTADMDYAGRSVKRIREVFGMSQVLEFAKPKSPEPTPKVEGGLPPGESTMPRKIKAPDISGKVPISAAEIRDYISQSLDIPIRAKMGNMYSSKYGGVFKPKEETIRMNKSLMTDIPGIAHEVGHYLHYILFPGAKDAPMSPKASDFHKKFDGELLVLGAPGSGMSSATKSGSKHRTRKEGVAEFTRHYLVDKNKAQALAPEFFEYFERELQRIDPEVWKAVTRANQDIATLINQPAKAKVEGMIDFGHNQVGKSFSAKEFWEKQVNNWVDELAPIKRSTKDLKELKPEEDPYELAINYSGWRGKVEHSLGVEQLGYDSAKVVGPAFKDILKDIKSLSDFSTYLVAKRMVEKSSQGKQTGIHRLDAIETVKQLEPEYKEAAKKFWKFQHNELKILEDAGMISAKERLAMIKKNQFYAPFHRVLASEGGRARHGSGFVDTQKGVKAFTGSGERITDPLETAVKNVYLFRDLAERQRVAKAFVNAVENTRGGGRVAEQVAKPLKPIEVKPEEIERYFKKWLGDMGMSKEEAAQLSETAPEFKIWRTYNPTAPGQQVISVWKGGKQKLYEIADTDLYNALTMKGNTANSKGVQGFLDSGIVDAFLKFPTRTLRAGATLVPEFMARNLERDQIQAAIYSKTGYIPYVDGFRGMFHVLKKDKVYHDWVKAGGRYADFLAGDRKDVTKTLADFSGHPEMKDVIKKWGNPLLTLQKMSEVMEAATRVSEFRRAKERGMSDVEAANLSKDITLNYSMKGSHGKVYNMLSVFFNSKIQDIHKFAREQKANPVETNLKAMLYITTPSLLAWYMGKDDKEIQNLPEWRKTLFWNVNMRPVAEKAGIEMDDFVMSFPKPFLLGTIYGTGPEKALDYIYKDDKRAGVKFLEAMALSDPLPFSPLTEGGLKAVGLTSTEGEGGFPSNYANWENFPTGIKIFSELLTNYDSFRKTQIENISDQGLPKELRFDSGTSETGKLIGPKIGQSPKKFDFMTKAVFAGMGKYALDATDLVLLKSGMVEAPPKPAKMFRELPIIRAFSQSPYAANRQVEEFYRGYNKMAETLATVKRFDSHTGSKQQKKFIEENWKRLAYYNTKVGGKPLYWHIGKQKERLSTVSKTMTGVQILDLTPKQKQERLYQLSKIRNGIAEYAVHRLYPPDYKDIK